jgi:hypothetical protein
LRAFSWPDGLLSSIVAIAGELISIERQPRGYEHEKYHYAGYDEKQDEIFNRHGYSPGQVSGKS